MFIIEKLEVFLLDKKTYAKDLEEAFIKKVRRRKGGDAMRARREARRYRRTHRSKIKTAERKRKRLTSKAGYKRKKARMAKQGKTVTGSRMRKFLG